jgi:hypothetical protein
MNIIWSFGYHELHEAERTRFNVLLSHMNNNDESGCRLLRFKAKVMVFLLLASNLQESLLVARVKDMIYTNGASGKGV